MMPTTITTRRERMESSTGVGVWSVAKTIWRLHGPNFLSGIKTSINQHIIATEPLAPALELSISVPGLYETILWGKLLQRLEIPVAVVAPEETGCTVIKSSLNGRGTEPFCDGELLVPSSWKMSSTFCCMYSTFTGVGIHIKPGVWTGGGQRRDLWVGFFLLSEGVDGEEVR